MLGGSAGEARCLVAIGSPEQQANHLVFLIPRST